jgi:hypothetical protein
MPNAGCLGDDARAVRADLLRLADSRRGRSPARSCVARPACDLGGRVGPPGRPAQTATAGGIHVGLSGEERDYILKAGLWPISSALARLAWSSLTSWVATLAILPPPGGHPGGSRS